MRMLFYYSVVNVYVQYISRHWYNGGKRQPNILHDRAYMSVYLYSIYVTNSIYENRIRVQIYVAPTFYRNVMNVYMEFLLSFMKTAMSHFFLLS